MKKFLLGLVAFIISIALMLGVFFIATKEKREIANEISGTTPKSLKADDYENDSLTLSWRSVPDATGYEIYQCDNDSNDYDSIADSIEDTEYTVTGLDSGTEYTFKVRAYFKYFGKVVYSKYSKSLTTTTCPEKVDDLTATCSEYSAKLIWSPVQGATGYKIYQYDPFVSDYTQIGSTGSEENFEISGLSIGKKYEFKVRAYINTDDDTVLGEFSDAVTVELKKPTIKNITVAAGGSIGTYYAFATAVGNVLKTDDYNFTIISTGGSMDNIKRIADGTSQFAIVQSDVINYAYTGTNSFSAPITDFSVIACAYPEVCQVVASKASGITSIADLKGKTVAIGNIGSGVYYNAKDILDAAGLTENDITIIYSSLADASQSLKDGKIDAAFITASAPTPAVTELSSDIVLVDLGNDIVNNLISKNSYYDKYEITGANYSFVTKTINTIAIRSVFITTNAMSDEQAYEITKNLWEKQPEIAIAHTKGNELSTSNATSTIGDVPLHPGAEKYYKEIGVIS